MEIFKSNEEVIDLVLTPKGRELLSTGNFKPHSYSFHDIDIMYEANNGESQNDTVSRIKNTIRIKTPTYFRNGDFYRDGKTGKVVKKHFLGNEIGDKLNGNQYAPAWKINFKEGPDFQNYISGSISNGVQLNSLITPKYYTIKITDDTFTNIIENEGLQETIPQININYYYQLVDAINFIERDGKPYLKTFLIEDRDSSVEIEEINSFEENEFSNFDLEIYLEDKKSGELLQLVFDKEIPDKFSVERYLNIAFDESVDFEDIVKSVDIYGAGGRDTPTNC